MIRDVEYPELVRLCEKFLRHHGHYSQQEQTIATILEMRKHLNQTWIVAEDDMKMMYDNPLCGPVIINQRLSEMDLAQVKELKNQLNRILYDAVVREQELTGPPPLGIIASEKIDTGDKMR